MKGNKTNHPKAEKPLNQRQEIKLDVDRRKWLQKKSEDSGIPVGEIIRQAIDLYRDKNPENISGKKNKIA